MADNEARRTAERIARESYGRLVAFLAARTRDVAGAEDALAEAFATALRTWPEQGVPNNPAAWLLTAARRRQIDAARRYQVRQSGLGQIKLMSEEIEEAAATPQEIPDRRLALMFACAHPAIERGMRAPLILQTVLGLRAEDIAPAFLVAPSAMGQRLVRAKTRIRDAGIPFRVPESDELPDRLDAVLEAIYAAYAKGWSDMDSGGRGLADEAIWLGQMVVSLLPAEPEAKGMLALMLYAESRRAARRDPDGRYVPLDRQEIDLWNLGQVELAEALLHAANKSGPSGRYQIEAAIQSVHAARRFTGATDWAVIVALYDRLFERTGSPVVLLNRAIALAEVEGPAAALASLSALAADKRMADYQPYWAARAQVLARTGNTAEAADAYRLAIGLETDLAVRAYLGEKLRQLGA